MNYHDIVQGFIIEDLSTTNGMSVSIIPKSRFTSLRNQGVIRTDIFRGNDNPHRSLSSSYPSKVSSVNATIISHMNVLRFAPYWFSYYLIPVCGLHKV